MKPSPSPWERLAAAARRAEVDERDVSAPYGFSTRVAALALAGRQPAPSLVQRFALRAFGVACALMIASVALNLGPILRTFDEDTAALHVDVTAEFSLTDFS